MEVELERVEAKIASYEGQKVIVRMPIRGTVEIAFNGQLHFQINTSNEPQFLIIREGNPGVVLVFQVYDVDYIYEPDNPNKRTIVLKKAVDNIKHLG